MENSTNNSNGEIKVSGDAENGQIKPSSKSIKVALPYTCIFKPDAEFALTDAPFTSKIVDYELQKVLVSPYVYNIELSYGNFRWIIKRRYNHYRNLHNQIWLFYTKLALPLPTHNSRENRKALAKIGDIEFPKFPMIPETILMQERISKRVKSLEEYLQFLLDLPLFRQHPAVLNFLEISPYSFIEELGHKGKEFLVKKRAGGFRSAAFCTRVENFFTDLTGHWRKRWLIVKDTCLFYIRPKDNKVRYVMLFDMEFFADAGIKITGVQCGVRIRNMNRELVIKCGNTRRAKELADYLNDYSKIYASDFVNGHRFGSFAPIRHNIRAQWFVDGCAYFEAVSEAIEAAKEEIFIADWWLSPEIYLRRPSFGLQWRLDYLLKKKAEQGVRIFILLFKEMEIGISINSIYTKHTLMKMHKNICVLRHPDAVRGGPLLWSHHEKLVVIDQKYAFVGGIDLCFGRWDNYNHLLTDSGGISFDNAQDTIFIRNSTRPTGLRYRSSSQPFLAMNQTPDKEVLPSGLLPADNIESVSMDGRIIPEDSSSSSEDEDQTNNDHNETIDGNNNEDASGGASSNVDKTDEKDAVDSLNLESLKNRITNKIRTKRNQAITKLRQINNRLRHKRSEPNSENISYVSDVREDSPAFIKQNIPKVIFAGDISTDELEGAAKLWHGKDYTNFIVKDFTNLDMPFKDSIDRHTTPRMPWHDLSCIVVGSAARDVARHFIQRWNCTKFSKAKFDDRYNWLVPRTYSNIELIEMPRYLTRTQSVKCQVLRSVSSWSIGVQKTEASIVDAYIEAISNAEHYIYIENQFFISQAKTHLDSTDIVKNRINEAIYRRIIRAHNNRQPFKVFVLIPLLPAFEGELGTSSGSSIQQITYYNYSTIVKGADSLLGKLRQQIDDPSQYIGFYSLRNYDELNGRLVTELIYVHSKLLIADDKLAIIGSANINDRSMLGYRDSEVAVILEDQEFETHTMNGQPYKAGKFAGSLRRLLMAEHLGIFKNSIEDDDDDDDDETSSEPILIDMVDDPISDHFWNNIWNSIAQSNTSIYEDVFPVIPSDEIKTLADIDGYMQKTKLYKINKAKAQKRLDAIRGHLVCMPLDFLCNESNATSNFNAQEHFLPQIVWT